MEIFYEKNVVNKNIDKHRTRNKILRILQMISLGIFVFIFVSLFSITVYDPDESDMARAYVTLIVLLCLLLPLSLYFLFGWIIKLLTVEYDYVIMGDRLKILKIVNRKKRKPVLDVELSSINLIGLVGGEKFNDLCAAQSANTKKYFCNPDAFMIYIYLTDYKGRSFIIIEADDEFLINIKKSLKNFSTLDDDLKKYMLNIGRKKENETVLSKDCLGETASDVKE